MNERPYIFHWGLNNPLALTAPKEVSFVLENPFVSRWTVGIRPQERMFNDRAFICYLRFDHTFELELVTADRLEIVVKLQSKETAETVLTYLVSNYEFNRSVDYSFTYEVEFKDCDFHQLNYLHISTEITLREENDALLAMRNDEERLLTWGGETADMEELIYKLKLCFKTGFYSTMKLNGHRVHHCILQVRWTNLFEFHNLDADSDEVTIHISDRLLMGILRYMYTGAITKSSKIWSNESLVNELYQVIFYYRIFHFLKILLEFNSSLVLATGNFVVSENVLMELHYVANAIPVHHSRTVPISVRTRVINPEDAEHNQEDSDHSSDEVPINLIVAVPHNPHDDAPLDLRVAVPGDPHGAAPDDSHRAAPDDSHRAAPDDSHRAAPDDSHRAAPDDSHRAAPDDSHRAAPDDSHGSATCPIRKVPSFLLANDDAPLPSATFLLSLHVSQFNRCGVWLSYSLMSLAQSPFKVEVSLEIMHKGAKKHVHFCDYNIPADGRVESGPLLFLGFRYNHKRDATDKQQGNVPSLDLEIKRNLNFTIHFYDGSSICEYFVPRFPQQDPRTSSNLLSRHMYDVLQERFKTDLKIKTTGVYNGTGPLVHSLHKAIFDSRMPEWRNVIDPSLPPYVPIPNKMDLKISNECFNLIASYIYTSKINEVHGVLRNEIFRFAGQSGFYSLQNLIDRQP